MRTRSYHYTACTRGPCVHVHGSSRDAWHWPGGESSEEGGAGLRHCAVAAVGASLPLRRHHRRHSRRRHHLHPPRFSAFPSTTPSASAVHIAAAHRCRPRRVRRRRQHRPPASATAIAATCVATTAKGRRLGIGRGRGLGYGYKVRVRVRVRERVATSQSGGPRRIQTSTALRP